MFHLMVAYNKVTFTLWQTGQVLPKAQALGLLRLCRTLKMLEDLHNHNTDECRKSQLAVVPGLHYQVSTRLVTKPKVCSIKPIFHDLLSPCKVTNTTCNPSHMTLSYQEVILLPRKLLICESYITVIMCIFVLMNKQRRSTNRNSATSVSKLYINKL